MEGLRPYLSSLVAVPHPGMINTDKGIEIKEMLVHSVQVAGRNQETPSFLVPGFSAGELCKECCRVHIILERAFLKYLSSYLVLCGMLT